MILLQRAELWELRAGLRANRPWKVLRFRCGQVCWCVEWHAKTPQHGTTSPRHTGRGYTVSHAEGYLKDMETMKCEHGRDVFEVAPTCTPHTTRTTSAQPLPHPYQLPLTSSLLPSLSPIWLAPPCSLGRGVVESSVASNNAHPTHSPTHSHTYTLLFTDQLLL